MTEQQARRHVAELIARAVAEAPPLPPDLEARIRELIQLHRAAAPTAHNPSALLSDKGAV